jgi:oligoendopeptidase F
MMAKELPLRNELPESATWDLTKIFASDTDWQTAYDELNERLVNADFFAQCVIWKRCMSMHL